jgi:ribosome biogenesis GTPase A
MAQIQWFPGHMAKARRQVEEKLSLVDIIFVLLDARIPFSSENPMIFDIIKDKPILYILNKSDLADQRELTRWLDVYKRRGMKAVAINSIEGDSSNVIIPASKSILQPLFAKEQSRGMKERPFRAMVVGIPNVGKSAFINRLAKRPAAATGDKPGVTKAQKYIRVGDDLELLDNPGILWPRFEDPEVGLKLALVGSIKDDILPLDEVAIYGIKYLSKWYPGRIETRYGIEKVDPEDVNRTLDAIGKKRGAILPGNYIDYDRVIKLFLFEFRNQKFGKICLEKAPIHV